MITALIQHFGSLTIFLNLRGMLTSVKFHHQAVLGTTKIDNELTDWILAPKFRLI